MYPRPIEYQFPVWRILLMDPLKPEVRSVGVPAHRQKVNIRQPDPRYLQIQYAATCRNSLPFVLLPFYSQGFTPSSSIMLDPLSLRSHFVSGQGQNMVHLEWSEGMLTHLGSSCPWSKFQNWPLSLLLFLCASVDL